MATKSTAFKSQRGEKRKILSASYLVDAIREYLSNFSYPMHAMHVILACSGSIELKRTTRQKPVTHVTARVIHIK